MIYPSHAKYNYLLLCFFLLCIILSGCSKENVGKNSTGREGQFSLPETLSISAVLPEDYPKEVKRYTCSVFHPDEQNTASIFLGTDNYNTEEWALGTLYITDEAGIYPFYAFQGIGFTRTDFTARKYSYVIQESKFLPVYFSGDDMFGNAPIEKSTQNSLQTIDIAEEEEWLREKLNASGFPELRLKSVSCWDAETLNENRRIFQECLAILRKNSSQDSDFQSFLVSVEADLHPEYTQDDELVCMIFEQCVDGIPLTMNYWGTGNGSIAGRTYTYALFTKEGLAYLRTERICHIENENGMIPVMSPEKAISIFIEEYSKELSFLHTEIAEVELQYILCGNELGEMEEATGLYLRPVWVIRTEKEPNSLQDPTINYADWKFYYHESYCISADTGVILQSSADER